MSDPNRLVPPGSAKKGGDAPGPRPRSPTVAGLLSPAPIKHTPQTQSHESSSSSGGGGGGSSGGLHPHTSLPGSSRSPSQSNLLGGANTPLSLIRGFPDLAGPRSPNPPGGGGGMNDVPYKLNSDGGNSPMPMPFVTSNEGVATMGLTPFTSGAEATTLPQVSPWFSPMTRASFWWLTDRQFWADMFGIKLDGDQTLAL